MGKLLINTGQCVHKLYLYDGRLTCCSDDPLPRELGHPLAGGGMSSPQSRSNDRPTAICNMDIPQTIVVERDAKVEIIVVVMPGVSCDIRLDVRLTG